MSKCVQEFELKFYEAYIDALLDEDYELVKVEIENNHLPQSITLENDGNIKNYRLIPFKRSAKGSSLENVYVLIS
jgi:hypothetical protein